MAVFIEKKIVELLTRQKKTISVAESCTGGLVSQRLTSVPGASKVFGFGVISYSGTAKQNLLKVNKNLIRKYGEVSEEVALAMASGILKISKSDYALAITGIAGPTGGTAKKPVGMVCFSLLSKDERHIKKMTTYFKGNRNRIRQKAANTVLQLLYKVLKEDS